MAKKSKLPIKVEDLGLNPKELRFVGEYCTNNFDAIAAMKAAKLISESMNATEARLRGMELLNRPNINTAINRFVSSELDPYRDKLSYQILTSMQARAFYDPDTFFHSDGTAKPLDSIPAHMRQAIDSVEVKHYGKDGDVTETIYKLADRAQAQKNLIELLNRKAPDQEDGVGTATRSKLDEIFFKAGVVAGSKIAEEKQKLEMESMPRAVPVKDHILALKETIKAQRASNGQES